MDKPLLFDAIYANDAHVLNVTCLYTVVGVSSKITATALSQVLRLLCKYLMDTSHMCSLVGRVCFGILASISKKRRFRTCSKADCLISGIKCSHFVKQLELFGSLIFFPSFSQRTYSFRQNLEVLKPFMSF